MHIDEYINSEHDWQYIQDYTESYPAFASAHHFAKEEGLQAAFVGFHAIPITRKMVHEVFNTFSGCTVEGVMGDKDIGALQVPIEK